MKLLLFFFTLKVIMTCGSADWPNTTPASGGQNLKGKMFTLTSYRGGLVLYSPSRPPPGMSTAQSETSEDPRRPTTEDTTTTRYTSTRPATTTKGPATTTRPTTTTYPWTTASPTRGVSVCLRYITDQQSVSIFTLSPHSRPLSLSIDGSSLFRMTFSGYSSLYLQTNTFWSNIKQKIWTSVCVTVDTRKGVAQVFRDSMMSPRKLIPYEYSWSGEPTIEFSEYDGQVTDVQVWDYPLGFREVLYFQSGGFYGPYRGSALSWSSIRYSVSGKTLMEDSYESLMKLPDLRGEQKPRLKGEKKIPRKVFNTKKSKDSRRRRF